MTRRKGRNIDKNILFSTLFVDFTVRGKERWRRKKTVISDRTSTRLGQGTHKSLKIKYRHGIYTQGHTRTHHTETHIDIDII